MPAVDPSKLPQAKANGSWSPWQIVWAKEGTPSTWKRAKKVFTKLNGVWTEVWNSTPDMTIIGFTATNTTTLSFSGTADPNSFATTAKFEYREVGTSTWNSTSTTSTGMGNDVDNPVSFNQTATVSGTDAVYKNWEARSSGTNEVGTNVSTTRTLDCRKQGVNGGSGWRIFYNNYFGTLSCPNPVTACDSCGPSTYTQYYDLYTKEGCPSYALPGGVGSTCNCGTWNADTTESAASPFYPNGTQWFNPSRPGQMYIYTGTPGYYTEVFSTCRDCPQPEGQLCLTAANYYVTVCSLTGARSFTFLSCDPCTCVTLPLFP